MWKGGDDSEEGENPQNPLKPIGTNVSSLLLLFGLEAVEYQGGASGNGKATVVARELAVHA